MPDVSFLADNPLRGLCADLPEEQKEWFFAEGEAGVGDVRKAKAICNSGCPIKDKCLQIAVRTEVSGQRFGVFGGLSAFQRERQFKSWYREVGLCQNGLHPNELGRCAQCKAEADAKRYAQGADDDRWAEAG